MTDEIDESGQHDLTEVFIAAHLQEPQVWQDSKILGIPLGEISTKIFASPKSVRNIFNQCRDLKMVDYKHRGNRLVLQSTDRGFRMWKRYTRVMISTITQEFDDYFRDMQEYQRLKNMVDLTTLDPQKKVESTS